MENSVGSDASNPIPELIDGKTFFNLNEYGLLDFTALRNYVIKKKYRSYRSEGLSMFECLELLSGEYNLSYEYLRKMVGVKRVYIRKFRMLTL